MKQFLIAAALLAAGYGGYRLYTYYNSATTLDVQIVNADLSKQTITVRFLNLGNSPVKVNSVKNTILANDSYLATASNLKGFTIPERGQTDVKFDLQAGLGSIAGLLQLGKKKLSVITEINVKGSIIKLTNNII